MNHRDGLPNLRSEVHSAIAARPPRRRRTSRRGRWCTLYGPRAGERGHFRRRGWLVCCCLFMRSLAGRPRWRYFVILILSRPLGGCPGRWTRWAMRQALFALFLPCVDTSADRRVRGRRSRQLPDSGEPLRVNSHDVWLISDTTRSPSGHRRPGQVLVSLSWPRPGRGYPNWGHKSWGLR